MTTDEIRDWLATVPAEDLGRIIEQTREEMERRDVCEHGVAATEYCRPCQAEYRRARSEAGLEES